jgi:hypothetical protein
VFEYGANITMSTRMTCAQMLAEGIGRVGRRFKYRSRNVF